MAIQTVTITLVVSNPDLWQFWVGSTSYPITPSDFQNMMNANGTMGCPHVLKNIAMAASIGATVPTAANIQTMLAGRTFRI